MDLIINSEKNKENSPRKKYSAMDPKHDLAVKHMSLVYKVASRIARRLPSHVEMDDLVGSGMIGLMDAVSKFDPQYGVKFESYAEFRIKGAILDQLRVIDPASRDIRKDIKLYKASYKKLEGVLGRTPKDVEIQQDMGITQKKYDQIQKWIKRMQFVDFYTLSTVSGPDVLPGDKSEDPYDVKNYKELLEKLEESIKELPEKLQLVLSLYYKEELNLKEIGNVLNLTESRVSQLRSEALKKLKKKLSEF